MKKEIKTVIGYLSFLNENNKNRRWNVFVKSIENLKKIKTDQPVHLVNFDNNSCKEARDILKKSGFDKQFLFSNNFFDLSVLYGTYYYSKKIGAKYMIYCYDDIEFNGRKFLSDCELFMDENKHVDCVRLCEYRKDDPWFNTTHTSKQKNPDAINHWISPNNKEIKWSTPKKVGESIFHTTNWHYTSRSSMFRVESFEKIVGSVDSLPVLQFFELLGYNTFSKEDLTSAVLEGGVFKTLASHDKNQSERLNIDRNVLESIKIDKKEIELEINKIMGLT